MNSTTLLCMDENLPPGAALPAHRLSEEELRGLYSSFNRMLSPNRSFIDSLVELIQEKARARIMSWAARKGVALRSSL